MDYSPIYEEWEKQAAEKHSLPPCFIRWIVGIGRKKYDISSCYNTIYFKFGKMTDKTINIWKDCEQMIKDQENREESE